MSTILPAKNKKRDFPAIPDTFPSTLMDHFDELPDPRIDRTKRHPLINILVMALCAVICGADSFTEIEDFAEAKEAWFATFLDLSGGIPSHDTFARVFARLNPQAFSTCFLSWVTTIQQKTQGQVVALDGKCLRRSFDHAAGKSPIYMVSAWASEHGLVLGQVQVDEKSNEITAIPKLLEMLDISGSIITIDAIGTQKAIAAQINAQEADYVLAVKDNQHELMEEVTTFFGHLHDPDRDHDKEPIKHTYYQTRDADHGRIDTRRYWCTPCPEWLIEEGEWHGIKSFAMVEAERLIDGQVSTQRRYYISSLPPKAKELARAIRGHWGIENGLHWVLDMAFREDECRIRTDHAPANFATLRHMALNLLKKESTQKRSINRKRLLAGWENWYLEKVLTG